MGFALEDGAEELLGVGAIFFCPMENPGGVHSDTLVAFGMFGQGGKAALAIASWMTSDSLIFEEDLQVVAVNRRSTCSFTSW